MSTFSLSTLGCKVNQYESQSLREQFQALGWAERPFREGADLCVVNTCVVTAEAEEKCRREVRRARRANPRARVWLTGCATGVDAARWRRVPGVDDVFTRAQMADLAAILQGLPPVEGGAFDRGISRFEGHARAFLKIEEGCDAGCAYCIVPRARGAVQSRPPAEVLREAARLAAAGHREIVLTGVHLGHYGRGRPPGEGLAAVVRALRATSGLARLRLSSIEARELGDELLDLAAEASAGGAALCPHFHVPLQSGDDGVLRAMGRGYTATQFLDVLARARRRLDRPAFTTDVLVGFPGETEEAFENTLRLCRAAGFSRIHAFPFSPRPGTPAAALPGRVRAQCVRERMARLDTLSSELALAYGRLFTGERVHPLIELRRDRSTGLLAGRTERYLRVLADGPDAWKGAIVPVTVRAVHADHLRCVAL
jgi:threonylcarbamoyladenosine tRNA methylthiotransferase MtaB